MQKSEIVFEHTFKKELEPLLLDLGFSRLSLPQGWIQPEFLYKHNTRNLWVGCSWDWRDFYFDAELGRLHKMRDVLPRVIVCGFSLIHHLELASAPQSIEEQFINVKDRFATLTNNNYENYNKAIDDAYSAETLRLKDYLEEEIKSESKLPFI